MYTLKEINEKLRNGSFTERNVAMSILTDYADAEEQGLLIKLPCKVVDISCESEAIKAMKQHIETLKEALETETLYSEYWKEQTMRSYEVIQEFKEKNVRLLSKEGVNKDELAEKLSAILANEAERIKEAKPIAK